MVIISCLSLYDIVRTLGVQDLSIARGLDLVDVMGLLCVTTIVDSVMLYGLRKVLSYFLWVLWFFATSLGRLICILLLSALIVVLVYRFLPLLILFYSLSLRCLMYRLSCLDLGDCDVSSFLSGGDFACE